MGDLSTGLTFELPEILLHLHEIRTTLRVEIAHDVGEPQRQLAPLPHFALVDHRFDAHQQVIVRDGIPRRSQPRAELLLQPSEIRWSARRRLSG